MVWYIEMRLKDTCLPTRRYEQRPQGLRGSVSEQEKPFYFHYTHNFIDAMNYEVLQRKLVSL